MALAYTELAQRRAVKMSRRRKSINFFSAPDWTPVRDSHIVSCQYLLEQELIRRWDSERELFW